MPTINTDDFKDVRTYQDLLKAAAKVRAVVSSFCLNAVMTGNKKFAACEACPFYSKKYDECLSGFVAQVLDEEQIGVEE